ncbi:hypothetical protein LCGC14_0394970 [marine sediment metagenome]|uniref:Uncharacterized protein n=1 Tax=marine sediment metagenome TaxID=412755 RepID=A0A0F9TGB5_9ZZZZ
MDKFQHFYIIFFFTFLFNWEVGVTIGLTIEATQLEGYWQKHGTSYTLNNYYWRDTYEDLFYDTIGIKFAIDLKKLFRR